MDPRPTTNGKEFVLRALEEGLRVDGRSAFDYRHLSISFGRTDGSCEVQLGDTRVLACVSADLVAPHHGKPQEGKLIVQADISPMADITFEPGLREESTTELKRIIFTGIRSSIDMESLCVVPGKTVWEIRVSIHVLDNGGNLVDASHMAAVAALSVFRRCDCTIGEDGQQQVIKHDPKIRDPIPLAAHYQPIAITMAISGDGNTLVLDPTFEEEAVMKGKITVITNKDGEVCAIDKPGGAGLPTAVIMKCLRVAATKASDLTAKINYAVESYDREKALEKVKRA